MSNRHNAEVPSSDKKESRPGLAARTRRSWQVQEARARLSSLIDEALAGRPQRISRRGAEVAVLVSAADYDRLMAPRENLVEFFRNSPLAEAMAKGEIDLDRDPDAIRDLPW
ncbi:MAG: type II toxin-antitoxin system Phd/YefM family antitoxin [Geminicoccaceae bacterium]